MTVRQHLFTTAAAIYAIAAFFGLGISAPVSAQNLIANPSFEVPQDNALPAGCFDQGSWFFCTDAALPSWTVKWEDDKTPGNLEFQTQATLGLAPTDGLQYAELGTHGRVGNGDNNVEISQSAIVLCILDAYTLTYDHAKREDNDFLAVRIDGAAVAPVGPAPAVQSFNNYSVAIGPGFLDVDVAFAEVGPGGSLGSLLDNVSLTNDAVQSGCEPNINVHPGSDPNPLNLGSGGSTPVAIFGSAVLDVSLIIVDSLTFADAGVKTVGKSNRELCNITDIGSYDEAFFDNLNPTPDGFVDLVCHFVTAEIAALGLGEDITVEVHGDLTGGGSIWGSDLVKVVKE